MREECLELVLTELEGDGGPEGVQDQRVGRGAAGDFVFSLTKPGHGVKQISLRTPASITEVTESDDFTETQNETERYTWTHTDYSEVTVTAQ